MSPQPKALTEEQQSLAELLQQDWREFMAGDQKSGVRLARLQECLMDAMLDAGVETMALCHDGSHKITTLLLLRRMAERFWEKAQSRANEIMDGKS